MYWGFWDCSGVRSKPSGSMVHREEGQTDCWAAAGGGIKCRMKVGQGWMRDKMKMSSVHAVLARAGHCVKPVTGDGP